MNALHVSAGRQTQCPIDLSLDLVGDRWSILILRELFEDVSHFDEIQTLTGASSQILSGRLKAFEAGGVLVRKLYWERPKRFEYLLTDKGRAFYPVLFALRAWGEAWCKPKGQAIAVSHTHRLCGFKVNLEFHCAHCNRSVEHEDIEPHESVAWAEERANRIARAKAG